MYVWMSVCLSGLSGLSGPVCPVCLVWYGMVWYVCMYAVCISFTHWLFDRSCPLLMIGAESSMFPILMGTIFRCEWQHRLVITGYNWEFLVFFLFKSRINHGPYQRSKKGAPHISIDLQGPRCSRQQAQ